MNLHDRLELAGHALLALLDPARDFLPLDGYEAAHDLGRWWDAVLRLEETIGFRIPAELEAASLRNLHRLTENPDRLLMNRADISWLRERAKINPHNFRETLLAFGGLVRRRQSVWARQAGLELVQAMDRCLQADGSLDLTRLGSWGSVSGTTDPSHTEPRRNGWFDATATSGRSLEALVWFYQATGDSRVLALARRVAEHHLRCSTQPDGTVRPEILDAENVGHDHSYLGTLRGLLRFGLLTQQREYVDTVAATYRNGVRNRIVHESGWAPHDLGKTRFPNGFGDPVTDPASSGDAVQLALWLALDAGHFDLLDDVERLLRGRLFPAQLTPADAVPPGASPFPARQMGAWAIHGPSHAGKGCTPDVLAAVTHTLCDVYGRICTRTPQGMRVNLHLDYEDADIAVRSRRAERAEVAVTVRRPGDLLVRIPQWAPAATLRLNAGARAVPVTRLGPFAWVADEMLGESREVVMAYDLPARRTEERMPSGRVYTFAWRGDEIVGVSPQDEPLPFYLALTTGRA